MHHTFRVGRFQSAAHLDDDGHRFFGGQLASLAEEFLKVVPLHELHGDEFEAVGFAKIENTVYVFMGNLPRQDQLLLEPADDLGLLRQFRANRLEGYYFVELPIPGFVDRPHAAFAQQFHNFVAIA